MKEEIVSFETAKLLKEKGFDWKTPHYYQRWKESKPNETQIYNHNFYEHVVSAPTQSLAQKWLREENKIEVQVWFRDETTFWYCGVYSLPGCSIEFFDEVYPRFNTYEEALEKGLKEALKLI